MKYEVVVELKKEVLDAEGRAIQEALERLDMKGVSKVQVSKRYVLDVSQGGQDLAEKLASEVLANPVSETFTVKE